MNSFEETYLKIVNRLIAEDKNEAVNIGQSALGYLKSLLREDTLSEVNLEILKDRILKYWPFYDDFCKNYKGQHLFIAKVDMANKKKVNALVKKVWHNVDKDYSNLSSNGKHIGSATISLILVNTNALNEEDTILHEFMHFIQKITKNFKNKSKLPDSDSDYQKYLSDEYEFNVHIYTKLFRYLQKCYWRNHGEFEWDTWMEFIDHFRDFVKISVKDLSFKLPDSFNVSDNETCSIRQIIYLLSRIKNSDIILFNKIFENLANKNYKVDYDFSDFPAEDVTYGYFLNYDGKLTRRYGISDPEEYIKTALKHGISLNRLAQHENQKIREYLALTTASKIALKILSKDNNANIRKVVAENPNTSADVLNDLCEDLDKDVRNAVAQNPNTPSDALEFLANDENRDVKLAVVFNKNTPNEVLEYLNNDKDSEVRRNAEMELKHY